ncbi:MAG: hypothetical protein ACM3NF_02725 [Gemmatimonadota bacterium]
MPTPRVGLSLLACAMLVALACTESGAAPRARPDLASRLASIRTVGLIAPEIRIYEFSAGGVREQRDEWSAAGKENVVQGILGAFREKDFAVKPIAVDEGRKEEIEDIKALYRAVVRSILVHSQGPNAFPPEYRRFDYTLGNIDTFVDAFGVDALLFAYGVDEVSTGGRKTLAVLGLIGGVVLRPGFSVLGVGLVDRSGEILWYNSDASAGGRDLRNPESASTFTRELLSAFPAVAR